MADSSGCEFWYASSDDEVSDVSAGYCLDDCDAGEAVAGDLYSGVA